MVGLYEQDDATTGGRLTIDLGALRANYATLASSVAPSVCGAVVKADAYGLGAIQVATALYDAGCREFFVAQLGEGLALKPHLPVDVTVYVLNGVQPGGEATCAQAGLVPVLNGIDQFNAWADLCVRRGRRLPTAIQVDSGMSRLGLSTAEVEIIDGYEGLRDVMDVRLVMSHLACADEQDHPANEAQRRAFARLSRRFPAAFASLANSGGVLLDKAFHLDLTRPGIALYGVSPTIGDANELRPVARLEARVIQVRGIEAGANVGYGASFVSKRPMRLATVAVGYADGWPRHLSDIGAAYFGEIRLPIVGRISMDSTTLDVSEVPEGCLRLGSLVELFGTRQSVDEVARLAGTISYEILTRLGRRFARRYVDGQGTTYPSKEKGRTA